MSLLVDNAQLITGNLVVRQVRGLGVRGDQIPSLGQNGPSVLFDDFDPGDEAKEFWAEVLSHTFPPQAKFFMFDDGSFTVDPACPDGVYEIVYRGKVDGVVYGASITETINIGGVAALSLNVGLDLIGGALSFSPNVAFLALASTLDDIVTDLSLAEPPSVAVNSTMEQIGCTLDFASGPGFALPAIIPPERVWKIPVDLPLDLVGVFYQQQQVQPTWIKDKDSRLDYALDWSEWMSTLTDDTIATVQALDYKGDIVVPAIQARAGSVVAFWVEAGTIGPASFTLRITTALGRQDDRTVRFIIEER